jgi:heme/copper-type cytochrome/quinol oxidase subunit 3
MEETMNKNKALVLLFFTLLPFLYVVFFFYYWIEIFVKITNNQPDNINSMFFVILPIHFGIMIETIVLLIIYIKNVFKNENIEESKRALWAIVLFFGNLIAMPIYWYINIWKPIKKNQK